MQTYRLSNKNGVAIEFLALGGRINSINIPHENQSIDIVLGYETMEDITQGDAYMGALCGRVANRISEGKFTLEGRTYQLAQNDRSNHLHGGMEGFNKKVWKVSPHELPGYSSAFKLSYVSADGEENYPGRLELEVIYALNDANEFLIDTRAHTDKTTVVNIASHPYFNLNGVAHGKIFNHELFINAQAFTPLSEMGVPTGEIRKTAKTPMDFTAAVMLSERINSEYEQIQLVGGFDHNWVIAKEEHSMALACRISEPSSGRALEVYTTQPGIQVYAGMHFDGSSMGKGGLPLTQFCGIALEAQNFPDAPNKANFPSAVLKAGEEYHETTMYKFIF